MSAKDFMAGLVSGLVLVTIAAGAYFLGRSSESTESIATAISPTPGVGLRVPSPINIITPTPSQKAVSSNDIMAAITSKNYAALAGFMTNPISVSLWASECCQPMTPEAAVGQLDYLNDAEGPWDFNNKDVIASLEASYPENYGNAIIGISANDYLVGFQLNADKIISRISMSADYNLLLQ